MAAAYLLATTAAFALQQSIPAAELKEEMRIVSNESSVETSLTALQPTGVVLDDGRLLTLHRMEGVVRVWDASGRFVSMFGRKGQGPGEFQDPLAMGRTGELIWVFAGGRRYELFGADFKSVDRMTLPGGMDIGLFGLSPQRTTLLKSGRDNDTKAGIYGSGGLVRSVDFDMKQVEHNWSIGGRSYESPLQSRNIVLLSRDGTEAYALEPAETWGGRPGQLRISSIDLRTGRRGEATVASLPPRRVTASERDSIVGAQVNLLHQPESTIEANIALPDFYPPFYYVDAMGQGLLLIREWTKPNERIAVDAAGQVLWRAQLPQPFKALHATRTHLWVTFDDADGLPVIVRYAVGSAR